jgi:hypothetical protein
MSRNLIVLTLAAAVILNACAQTPANPIVEKPGVTVEQMNRDMAGCQNNPPVFAPGNYISNCMKAKGYTILSSS